VAEPWRPEQISALAWRLALSAATIFAGWYGVATTPDFSDQAPWLALGTGGAVLGGLAAAGWLLAGFRQVKVRQRLLMERLGLTQQDEDSAAIGAVINGLVTGRDMTRYHHADCLLVRGKRTVAYTGQVRRRNLRPCGVCRP
jgi:hypothetical protein